MTDARTTDRPRVLVIGLDGATFDLITPWVDKGELPCFKRLLQEGGHGELKAIPIASSPQSWSSFMTGKNPGKHGVFFFTERIPGTYDVQFANARSRKGKSLWRIASNGGKKVVAVNVPMTYPPEEVNGAMISGFDAPDTTNFVYPPELEREIRHILKDYIIDLRLRSSVTKNKRGEVLEGLKLMEEQRYKLCEHMMDRCDWDLFMVVFNATDRVQPVSYTHLRAHET